MKEVSMGTIVAVAAVVVVVLGLVAWRVFARPTVQVSTPQDQQQVQQLMRQEYGAEARRGGMAPPGGTPAPAGMPAPSGR